MDDVASGLWNRLRRPIAVVLLGGALGIGSAGQASSRGYSMSEPGPGHAAPVGAVRGVQLSAAAPVTRTIPLKALGSSPHKLVLEVGDITFATPPSVAYDVYVDLPPGAAPDPHGPHHVGSLTFYGLDGRHTAAAGQVFDITGLARAKGFDASKLAVTFVPFDLVVTPGGAPAAPRSASVTIGRIDVRAVGEPRR